MEDKKIIELYFERNEQAIADCLYAMSCAECDYSLSGINTCLFRPENDGENLFTSEVRREIYEGGKTDKEFYVLTR